MCDVEKAITDRRSIRMFQSDRPVPRDHVDEALELAAPHVLHAIEDNVVFHDY